jgi:MFS family permease
MTQLTDIAAPARAEDTRVIAVVSAAHFVSHYYILLLPPLFLFVRAEYGVSFTELGFALAAFNVVSAVLQTPAGFLVDRWSARLVLVVGLLLGAGAFAVVGLVHSFWLMFLMFGIAGIGNTAYHPADYSLLSHHVSSERIGQAYSIHAFAGFAGSAVAPATLLLMESLWGWRGAFFVSAGMGALVALVLLFMRDATPVSHASAKADDGAPAGWQLLFSGPILRNLIFFILLALLSGGMNNYSVVALNAINGTPLAIGNTALTAYLSLMAAGVLAGGLVVTRTSRHVLVAVLGLGVAITLAVLLATVDLGSVLLMIAMSVGGFFTGILVPSRDLIVRESTPPGSFGKVFGFVTTGFNLGGIVAPLIFGPLMDHGSPNLVFWLVAAFCLLSIGTVIGGKVKSGAANA